jgi:flagellar motor switch protein FliG
MTIIVMGISFIVIWLGTTFFIVRYIKKLKDDLFDRLSATEKPSEKKVENIPEEDKEGIYNPFDYVKRADPKNLLNFIKQEHPQIIALVLAHLEADKASVILQKLPSELQGDVSRRIATMDIVSPEITREIEQVLEKKLSALSGEDYVTAGGIESIAKILSHVDSDSRDQITEAIEYEDPELAYMINGLMTEKKPKKSIYH